MNLVRRRTRAFGPVVLVAALAVAAASCQPESGAPNDAQGEAVFVFEAEEFPGAQPWTSIDFANDPDDFQFAVFGDRGGGANPLDSLRRS